MTQRLANPEFSIEDAQRLVRERFGLEANCSDLPSYIDRNFRVDAGAAGRFVLRISNEYDSREILELQNAAMAHLARKEPGLCPEVRSSLAGEQIESVVGQDEREHAARLVTFLEGSLMPTPEACTPATWRSLGELLARVDRALADFQHPAMQRDLRWDLARAARTLRQPQGFGNAKRCALVQAAQMQFLGEVHRLLPRLPRGVIHNDANDRNLVLRESDQGPLVCGLFDFGDVLHSPRIFELAIACAYAIFGRQDVSAVICQVTAGYHGGLALDDDELQVLLPAIRMRLVQSVTISATDAALDPRNAHVSASEDQAWKALEALATIEPRALLQDLREACGQAQGSTPGVSSEQVRELRTRHLGPSLSLAYEKPLEIVKGRGSYLFDRAGRAYLDGVNNVCHVGHCHPKVVAAGQAQMAELNTNTRYLHPNIVEYARRLSALMPDPLSVCFFVNSGSEANELAVRMARSLTGRRDIVTLEGGYHGNTSTLIDLSPYKHDGPGGQGAPDWVYSVPCPDPYRGPLRAPEEQLGEKYAEFVAQACRDSAAGGTGVAAFLAEPLIGCGGQIVPPEGYLRHSYAHARAAGALCIADEVQIGFGRVGRHWWGFELDAVVPDIVTLGKPMGNGHPMAAVVTTAEVAKAFATGMEYFNTFGGNPVSCAIGLAVLDVLAEEDLRSQAQLVGEHLLAGFRGLAREYDCIGDVRGVGLYLGVELVKSRGSREPAPELLSRLIEEVRDSGLLLSSDGPQHNVLKIKPPLSWTLDEARLTLSIVERCLQAVTA